MGLFADYYLKKDDEDEKLTPSQEAAKKVTAGNSFADYYGIKTTPISKPEPVEIQPQQVQEEKPTFGQKVKTFVSNIFKKKEEQPTGEKSNPMMDSINQTLARSLEDRYNKIKIEQEKDEPRQKKIDQWNKDVAELEEALAYPSVAKESIGRKLMVADKYSRERNIEQIKGAAVQTVKGMLDGIASIFEADVARREKEAKEAEDIIYKGFEELNIPESERQAYLEKYSPRYQTWMPNERSLADLEKDQKKALAEGKKPFQDTMQQYIDDTVPTNPTFSDQIVQGVGSMASFYIISVASGGTAVMPTILESLGESGSVYEDNKAQGQEPIEAFGNASKTFIANLVWNAALNKYSGLFEDIGEPAVKELKKRVIATIQAASGEGIQEAGQQLISNWNTGKRGVDVWDGVLESLGVGAIIGGGAKGIEVSTGADISPTAEVTGQANIQQEGEAKKEVPEEVTSEKVKEVVIRELEDRGDTVNNILDNDDGSFSLYSDNMKMSMRENEDTLEITGFYRNDYGAEVQDFKGQPTEILKVLEDYAASINKDVIIKSIRPNSVQYWIDQGYELNKTQTSGIKILGEGAVEVAEAEASVRAREAAIPPKEEVTSRVMDDEDIRDALQQAEGLSAEDIMQQYPDINLIRDVKVTEVDGNKVTIQEGEALTPYRLKGDKVLLQDGQTYIVSRNQFKNIQNQSVQDIAQEFAPELKELSESYKGGIETNKIKETIAKAEADGNEDAVKILKRLDALIKARDNSIFYNGGFDIVNGLNHARQLGRDPALPEGDDGQNLPDKAVQDARGYLGGGGQYRDEGITTKYTKYKLPSGTAYREILLKTKDIKPEDVDIEMEVGEYGTAVIINGEESDYEIQQVVSGGEMKYEPYLQGTPLFLRDGEFDTREEAFEAIKENFKAEFNRNIGKRQMDRSTYKSPHWDEPNVISWIRMQIQKWKGKKVSFLEELQSDWNSDARKKGTTEELKWTKDANGDLNAEQGDTKVTITPEGSKWYVYEKGGGLGRPAENIEEAKRHAQRYVDRNKVPANKFLGVWQEVSIKRALQEAVKDGSDYFAWISGDQTTARYNLRTHLDNVNWKPQGELKLIKIVPKGDARTQEVLIDKEGKVIKGGADQVEWEGKRLDEVLGKGMADAIMAKEEGKLEGEGLEFGGEWANNLYDKQVGNIVKKLTGAKIVKLDMELPIKTTTPEFTIAEGRDEGGAVIARDIKKGLRMYGKQGGLYVVVKDLGNGEFFAARLDPQRSTLFSLLKPENQEQYRREDDVTSVFLNEKFTQDLDKIQSAYEKEVLSGEANLFRPEVIRGGLYKLTDKIQPYQQGIELTPEVVARIKGESPLTKKPSGKKPFITKAAEKKYALEQNKNRVSATSGAVFGSDIDMNFSRATPEEVDTQINRIIKQSEISQRLAERLGFPIRIGRFNVAKAAAIYKHLPKLVRTKWGYNVEIISHEAAHFMQDELEGFSKANMKPFAEELKETSPYGATKPLVEGFAEYVRLWMTQPARAVKVAPKFTKYFESTLETYPDVYDAMTEAKSSFKDYMSQPAVNRVESQLSFAEDLGGEGIITRLTNKFRKLKEGFIDDLTPLQQFTEMLRKEGIEIGIEEDAYVSARLNRGVAGKAEVFLNYGTIGKRYWKKVDGKIKPNYKSKALAEILKPIEAKKALRKFSTYLAARRTLELEARNIETGIRPQDAKDTIAYYEKVYPLSFKKAAREIDEYQNNLLQYLVEHDVISTEQRDQMKELNKMYVPFYRTLEGMDQAGFMSGKLKQAKSPVKKIKGSQLEVIDPLESIVKNTFAFVESANTNAILLEIANLSRKSPNTARLFEKVDPDMSMTFIPNEEIRRGLLKNMGMREADLLFLPPEVQMVFDQFVGDKGINMFRPMMFPTKGNTITVLRKGKKEFYEVEKDLYASLMSLNRESSNMVINILSKPASWLRASATLSPEFIARNPLRDQWTAWFYSKSGYFPLIDLPRGMFELFSKGDVYQLWLAGGGSQSTLVALDRVTNKKTLDEVIKDNTDKAIEYVKNPVEALRALSEFFEVSTRLGEQRRNLNKLENPKAAAYAARNVTLDFNKMGAYMRAINMIIPFSNANIQGYVQFFEGMKKNPAKMTAKAVLGITIPTLILYALNRDDERWKEIPQWQKDIFWIVLLPDKDAPIIRIPKPYIVGQLFGSLPERIWEYIDSQDPKLMDDFWTNFAQTAFPSPIPTAILPIVEGITNYNFFLGQRLMSEGTTKLPKTQQYTHYTSEVSKKIGQLTGQSPIVIDNWINAWFGGLGKGVIRQLDPILEDSGVATPEKTLSDIPLAKAFVVRRPSGSAGVSVDRFYDNLEEYEMHEAYLKREFELGNIDEATRYAEKYNLSLVYDSSSKSYYVPEAKVYRRSGRVLSELRKLQKEVRQSKTLTSKEKREKIEKLDDLLTKVSKHTIEMDKEMETKDFENLKIKVDLGGL